MTTRSQLLTASVVGVALGVGAAFTGTTTTPLEQTASVARAASSVALPAAAARATVVVQDAAACTASPAAKPAATAGSVARDAGGAGRAVPGAPRGARVVRVCGPGDALGAVLTAAAPGDTPVYGTGPTVRTALAEVAAAHPGQRFVTLP